MNAQCAEAMALVGYVRIVIKLPVCHDSEVFANPATGYLIGLLVKTALLVMVEGLVLSSQSHLKHFRQVGLLYQSDRNARSAKWVNVSSLALTSDISSHSREMYVYALCENTNLWQIYSWWMTTMRKF